MCPCVAWHLILPAPCLSPSIQHFLAPSPTPSQPFSLTLFIHVFLLAPPSLSLSGSSRLWCLLCVLMSLLLTVALPPPLSRPACWAEATGVPKVRQKPIYTLTHTTDFLRPLIERIHTNKVQCLYSPVKEAVVCIHRDMSLMYKCRHTYWVRLENTCMHVCGGQRGLFHCRLMGASCVLMY